MNLSGDSVQAAMAFYKLSPADVIVLHDELDLAPGKVRVKTGGGHAGHNGIRSIAGHIGPDFARVRIGVGHPGDKRVVTEPRARRLRQGRRGLARPAAAPPSPGRRPTSRRAISRASRARSARPRRRPRSPRNPSGRPAAPAAQAEPNPKPTRNPLQRLMDRFR